MNMGKNEKKLKLLRRIQRYRYYGLYKMYQDVLRISPKLCWLYGIDEFDVESILQEERRYSKDKMNSWNRVQINKHPWIKLSEHNINLLIKRDCKNKKSRGSLASCIQKRYYLDSGALASVFLMKPHQREVTYFIYTDRSNSPYKVINGDVPNRLKNKHISRPQVYMNIPYLVCLKLHLENLQRYNRQKSSYISRYKDLNSMTYPYKNIELMIRHLFFKCCSEIDSINYVKNNIKFGWQDIRSATQLLSDKYLIKKETKAKQMINYKVKFINDARYIRKMTPPIFNLNKLMMNNGKSDYDHPESLMDSKLLQIYTKSFCWRHYSNRLGRVAFIDNIRHYEHYHAFKIDEAGNDVRRCACKEKHLIRYGKHYLKKYAKDNRSDSYDILCSMLKDSHW